MTVDLSFMTLDVFSDQSFGGNPLAVYPHAETLDAEQMQRIALEMNYSETTFLLPPKNPAHTARVRIFTPTAELPFAGHPNVGTAWALALKPHWIPGAQDTRRMTFEQQAGVVAVDVQRDTAGDVCGCWITPPQPYQQRHSVPRSALAQCQPNLAAFQSCDRDYGYPEEGFSLMVYFRETQEKVHGRMFGPLIGIQEDAATGSAAAALAGLLAQGEAAQWVLHQGHDMGRPSTLRLRTEQVLNADLRIQVGGCCVPMIEGVLQGKV